MCSKDDDIFVEKFEGVSHIRVIIYILLNPVLCSNGEEQKDILWRRNRKEFHHT